MKEKKTLLTKARVSQVHVYKPLLPERSERSNASARTDHNNRQCSVLGQVEGRGPAGSGHGGLPEENNTKKKLSGLSHRS